MRSRTFSKRADGVFVAHDLAEGGGVAVVADGRVERGRADADGLEVGHLVDRDAELHRQLLVGRLAPEFLGERHGGPAHLGNLVHEVDGQADGLRLVGQRALDGLLDPPGGIGAELSALARVEAFDGLDEPDVAFADQVEQGQAKVLVVMRDFDDQAQVGLDHVVARRLVAPADAAGEGHLLGDGEERRLGDLLEIELQAAALQGIGIGLDRRRLRFVEKGGRSVRRRRCGMGKVRHGEWLDRPPQSRRLQRRPPGGKFGLDVPALTILPRPWVTGLNSGCGRLRMLRDGEKICHYDG